MSTPTTGPRPAIGSAVELAETKTGSFPSGTRAIVTEHHPYVAVVRLEAAANTRVMIVPYRKLVSV